MYSRFRAGALGHLFALIAALCLASSGALAQLATGSIQGLVSDKSGAVIPNAAVTVTNSATGVSRSGMSNGDGLYVVPNLQPGDYTGAVEGKDFSKQVAEHVVVVVNGQEAVNFALDLGHATETVNVTEGATNIDTVSFTVG